jgi:hypothetical protein
VPNITYRGVPTVTQFQKDSSVAFAVRSSDRILHHLDWLIERYHAHNADPDGRLITHIVLSEIFLAANYWIKSYHEQRPNMKKERYPAVLALFEAAVMELSARLHCSPPQVAQQIKEIFGRDLTDEGATTDRNRDTYYFTDKERALLRIRFKGGLAYHYGIDADTQAALSLKPLDSAKFYLAITRRNGAGGAKSEGFPGWAPFVMTREREFYMSKHWLDDPNHRNIFHSSYTGGGMVSAAGTMEVKNGIITGIRPDSGHYRPLEHNIVGVLLALQMFGVRMQNLKIFNFERVPLGTAHQFVASRLTWQKFQESAAKFREGRMPPGQPAANPSGSRNVSNVSGDYNTSGSYNNP